jgi:hypothetical protein
MVRTKLTSDLSVADSNNYQTASISPTANALVLLFVTNTRPPFPGGAATTPTATGNGLQWVSVESIAFGGLNDRRLTCFRAMAAAPAAGQVTIDFGGVAQDFCAWSIFQYDNVDGGGTAGSAAIAQNDAITGGGVSLTATLVPSANPALGVSVGAIALDLLADPQRPVSPGAGFTEIDELRPEQTFGKGATLQTQDATTFIPGVSWSWTGAENAAAIVLEIKAAPAVPIPPPPEPSDEDEKLIRRFEPVLFLHADEKFVPVDAKRYIEHAALWSATAPMDDKNTWGVAAGTSRRPVVKAGELGAIEGEFDVYLGDELGAGNDERFLELGGWKDKSESAEPDVTDSTTNVYANRDKIADLYRTPELDASRFWYHAEILDFDGMKLWAGGSPGKVILNGLRDRHPRLVCYYLFFPAHEQSVDKDSCPGIEAREVACHAADWQCIAVMLEGDGTGSASGYKPKFFGHTGSRPTQVDIDGTPTFRPHQFDDDELSVMKVEAWRRSSGPVANQPEVNADHPRLYVARGSHSLYMKPGDHDVDPFPAGKEPRQCGGIDTPGLAPPDVPGGDTTLSTAAIIAKMVTFGFPFSIIVGWGAAILEAIFLSPPFGISGPGNDKPNPDAAPPAAGGATSGTPGITVRPAGLSIADAGGRVEDWRSRQGLQLDGRTYNYIVDRGNQVWWPQSDNERGFRGRWGQRVTTDPLPRRSGPRFPNYIGMFLLALADGVESGLLNISS